MATANKYIIKIDPAALLGKKDNDLSRSNVFLRLCGAKGGKYNTESYISGNDHEGLFCEINRYWPIQTNPILLWRGKKEREVKEVYLNMTIKEKDINRIYLIHVIPQKGIIQLIDKPD